MMQWRVDILFFRRRNIVVARKYINTADCCSDMVVHTSHSSARKESTMQVFQTFTTNRKVNNSSIPAWQHSFIHFIIHAWSPLGPQHYQPSCNSKNIGKHRLFFMFSFMSVWQNASHKWDKKKFEVGLLQQALSPKVPNSITTANMEAIG